MSVELSTKYFGFVFNVTKCKRSNSWFPKFKLDTSLKGVVNFSVVWYWFWFEIFFGKDPDEDMYEHLEQIEELNAMYYSDYLD